MLLAAACGTDQRAPRDAEAEDDVTVDLPTLGPLPPLGLPAMSRGETPNGLRLPVDLHDWSTIGIAERGFDRTLRVVLGNPPAVVAARYGQTRPWPEGAQLAQLVWSRAEDADDGAGATPGEFLELALMVKENAAFPDEGGWGYAVWSGPNLLPPTDEAFASDCVECHSARRFDDFVFTRPAPLPSDAAISAALPTPNGLLVPADFREWRLVGAARPSDGSLRVIVGNGVAAAAARAGDTDPWPDRSMLAQYIWQSSESADDPRTLVTGDFDRFTLMLRRGDELGFDGGWQFGAWTGRELSAPTELSFDRPCVNCHTGLVSDRDFVFTRPGPVPDLGG